MHFGRGGAIDVPLNGDLEVELALAVEVVEIGVGQLI